MCDEMRATHKAVISLRRVIAGRPCVTISKPVPKPVVWFAKSRALFAPYTLNPIRNKPDVLFFPLNSAGCNDTPGPFSQPNNQRLISRRSAHQDTR
jgi:hypothetical protein